jgi:uncharacterized membrane protein
VTWAEIVRAIALVGARCAAVVFLILAFDIEPPGFSAPKPMIALRWATGLLGAAITYWWRPRAIRRRIRRALVALLLAVGLYLLYRYVSVVPPAPGAVWIFVGTAYASYILDSFFFGITCGEGASIFLDRPQGT